MYFSCSDLLKLTILIQWIVCEWWLLFDVWEQKKCVVNNRTSIHLSMRDSFKARTPDQTYTENTFIKCWRVFWECIKRGWHQKLTIVFLLENMRSRLLRLRTIDLGPLFSHSKMKQLSVVYFKFKFSKKAKKYEKISQLNWNLLNEWQINWNILNFEATLQWIYVCKRTKNKQI